MTNKKQQEKGTKTQSTRSESVQGRTNKTTSRRLVVGRSNRITITRKKAGAVRKIPRLPLHDGAGRRRAQEVTLSQSEQQPTLQVVVLETRTPERSDESDRSNRSSVLESDTAVDENTMSDDHSASDSEGEDDDSTSTLSIRASTGETECQKPSTPELIEPYLQSCLHLKQLGGTCVCERSPGSVFFSESHVFESVLLFLFLPPSPFLTKRLFLSIPHMSKNISPPQVVLPPYQSALYVGTPT